VGPLQLREQMRVPKEEQVARPAVLETETIEDLLEV
jgi:hypothetical protein